MEWVAAGCSANRFRMVAATVAVLALAALLAPADSAAKKRKPIGIEPVVRVSMAVPEPPQGRTFNVSISGTARIAKVDGGAVKESPAQRCLTSQPLFVAVEQRDVGGGNERFADLRPPGSDGNPGNPTDPFDPQPVVLDSSGAFTGEFTVTLDDAYDPAQQRWEISARAFNYIGPTSFDFRHKKRKYRCFKTGTHVALGNVWDSWHLVEKAPATR